MTVEDLDRLVAALPEWERMPPPARSVSGEDREAALLVALHQQEAVERRRRFDARMESIRRTERTLMVLFACLAAGFAVAVAVEFYAPAPSPQSFLEERP